MKIQKICVQLINYKKKKKNDCQVQLDFHLSYVICYSYKITCEYLVNVATRRLKRSYLSVQEYFLSLRLLGLSILGNGVKMYNRFSVHYYTIVCCYLTVASVIEFRDCLSIFPLKIFRLRISCEFSTTAPRISRNVPFRELLAFGRKTCDCRTERIIQKPSFKSLKNSTFSVRRIFLDRLPDDNIIRY